MSEIYVCNKCGKEFDESEVQTLAYSEGANAQKEYVSPCCGASYYNKE